MLKSKRLLLKSALFSKLTTKTPERQDVNFKHILHVFLLLTLEKKMFAGNKANFCE